MERRAGTDICHGLRFTVQRHDDLHKSDAVTVIDIGFSVPVVKRLDGRAAEAMPSIDDDGFGDA